ncbi:putative metal-dependent hydrolase [Radiobacillus kanasensis]|uniref:YfiT family bacillithiol transferase n=1 Tax=Radiobacillus kanasensis TaxID=2844358 RepID=UPI001E36B94D|nr:putative metal-dependent hydrolase [Radiobacillus kanasensis]UFT99607.1 putative metal-dependent hydrolase [Radiobacillus kanasensis]
MDERYPIGQFEHQGEITKGDIEQWLKEVEELPKQIKDVVQYMSEEQLDTPYRDGGWSVRQVVHHVADSHMNSFIRFKLALTEENPTIKPYEEAEWAEQADYQLPVAFSLATIEAIHKRTVHLLQSIGFDEFEKTFIHPESGKQTLSKYLGFYNWHGRHHLAHITQLVEKMDWK